MRRCVGREVGPGLRELPMMLCGLRYQTPDHRGKTDPSARALRCHEHGAVIGIKADLQRVGFCHCVTCNYAVLSTHTSAPMGGAQDVGDTPLADTMNALALPTGTELQAVFRNTEAIDPLIKRIADEVRSHAPDLTTAKGRDAIAALAYKVSRSKTALDEAGKLLTEDAKKQIGVIDAARKKIRDSLDALRDEARKPLTDWEAEEKARVDRATEALNEVRNHGLTGEESSAAILEVAGIIKAVVALPEFREYLPQIEAAREATLQTLRGMYAAAKKREDQEAELESLRAEKAAREAAEQAAREAAMVEAAAKEAEAMAAARAAQIEREKQEAAEAAAQAERKASADREAAMQRQMEEERAREDQARRDAEIRHAREVAEAQAERDRAAQAERDRIAAEQKAADDARAKREADTAHRDRIASEITAALAAMAGIASPAQITAAMMAGKIPHVTVNL